MIDEATQKANLQLWDQVKTTNPKALKSFNKGYKGTAIDFHYQLHRATALWGPAGGKWGWEIKDETWKDSADPAFTTHFVLVELYYPLPIPSQSELQLQC